MKFNHILKEITGLACLSSFVFAKNDCEEIRKYVEKNEYADKIIEQCIENDNGQVTTLIINNHLLSLNQEDINKFVSYKTLNVLEYKYSQEYNLVPADLYGLEVNETRYNDYSNYYYVEVEDTKNSSKYIHTTNVPSFSLDELSELTEFKLTNINYYKPYRSGYCNSYYVKYSNIPSDIQFTLPNSLEKLYIEGVNLNQDFIDTITDLPNINEMHFNICDLSNVNLKSISIPNIIIEDFSGGYGDIPENVLSQLKNVENLTIKSVGLYDYIFKELGELTNLKELNILECIAYDYCDYINYLHGCIGNCKVKLRDLQWNYLYNLSKLTSLNINGRVIDNEDEIAPDFIENMKSLKKVEINEKPYEIERDEPTETIEPTNTSKPTETAEPEKCPKAKTLGYECCSHCHSIYSDKDGLWGAEHGKWCIIPDYCQKEYEECWSVKYGYPCCDHCKVHSTDKHGSWGVMNKNWCGIPNSC